MAQFPSEIAVASGTAQLANGSTEDQVREPFRTAHIDCRLTSFMAENNDSPSRNSSHTSFAYCIAQQRIFGGSFDDVGGNSFNMGRDLLQDVLEFVCQSSSYQWR